MPESVAQLPSKATGAAALLTPAVSPAPIANGARVASPAAPGDAAAVTPHTATPGAQPRDWRVLSKDERDILAALIAADRHKNLYRTRPSTKPGAAPGAMQNYVHYRGWTYLTNVVWYLRTAFNPTGRELTADELATFKRDLAGTNGRIPAKGGTEIPTTGPRGSQPNWDAIYFGGVIPYAQEVLPRVRASYFDDISPTAPHTSTSAVRSYRATHHADAAKDARADARRLQVLVIGKESLGTEYAQGHPEATDGKQYGRKRTLDCSGFVGSVFADKRLGFLTSDTGASLFELGSQVSTQYATAVRHPDMFEIVKGPKCIAIPGKSVGDSPMIEAKVETVVLTGKVLTGDIGLTGMDTSPHRGPSGGVVSDFAHVVIFTGRKGSDGKHECIHASDIGEGVDIGTKSIDGDVGVLIRPLL